MRRRLARALPAEQHSPPGAGGGPPREKGWPLRASQGPQGRGSQGGEVQRSPPAGQGGAALVVFHWPLTRSHPLWFFVPWPHANTHWGNLHAGRCHPQPSGMWRRGEEFTYCSLVLLGSSARHLEPGQQARGGVAVPSIPPFSRGCGGVTPADSLWEEQAQATAGSAGPQSELRRQRGLRGGARVCPGENGFLRSGKTSKCEHFGGRAQPPHSGHRGPGLGLWVLPPPLPPPLGREGSDGPPSWAPLQRRPSSGQRHGAPAERTERREAFAVSVFPSGF